MQNSDDGPEWKKLKLSLERPYKNDNGEHIPVLLDITPDGPIYEEKDDPSKVLGEKLRRIFVERGADFFDKFQGDLAAQDVSTDAQGPSNTDITTGESIEDEHQHAMTPEELYKMRMEILPQLYTALGEMSHAKDLLALLIASSPSASQVSASTSTNPPSILTATIVTKPPPIPSVEAFNMQLCVGGKDEALRKAAEIFKSAGESMERGRIRGDKYWVDALKIRRSNWGLIPAPLPFGSAIGKGADKTSKDFLISFGLEESPAQTRKRAVGRMSSYETDSRSLIFPHRQKTRLRVSLRCLDYNGSWALSYNTIVSADDGTLEGSLRAAQQEMVEQEIFTVLIREAGNLPTASSRVSERLIVIDAAQGTELRFELIDEEDSLSLQTGNEANAAKCDLVSSVLHVFLLRMHSHTKTHRLGTTGIMRVQVQGQPPRVLPSPPLLQPVIDLLQYEVFCKRVHAEVHKVVRALDVAGMPCSIHFNSAGESGNELVRLLEDSTTQKVGGEAVLRIDERHTIRLTFLSPSSLTAHLAQATLPLSSIPQLIQLLSDEVEQCLLNRFCEVGNAISDRVNGTWFVDIVNGRTVGRWEGCVLNFRVFFEQDFAIRCSAFRLDHGRGDQEALLEAYGPELQMSLLDWVKKTVEQTL
ncbi:hypothetical protein HWV62_3550 [Athelia sp. TMB]|nr:hypothetical protein HWV62_3550 [Athelia sp. TMB]